jgi:protein-tyrosine phosphatase
MGKLLVVDGADVCRAPIVSYTLGRRLLEAGLTSLGPIVDRGLGASAGDTMCESAATRLGFTGPAIAHYAAHRAAPLTVGDIRGADLVLTAERAHRSAVVRMLPGTQAMVFTWKEALVLASVLVDRRRTGSLTAPADLAALARALHGVRGTVPLIEPPVRTGPFHWRRAAETDPLTIGSGHDGHAEHRRITQESVEVAAALGARFETVLAERRPEVRLPEPVRTRRLGRPA